LLARTRAARGAPSSLADARLADARLARAELERASALEPPLRPELEGPLREAEALDAHADAPLLPRRPRAQQPVPQSVMGLCVALPVLKNPSPTPAGQALIVVPSGWPSVSSSGRRRLGRLKHLASLIGSS
jgi:hypothetical protein